MKSCLNRLKKLIWLILICAGIQIVCPWNAKAEEMMIVEEAVFTDTLGAALPGAYSYSTYSLRNTYTGWTYGMQLTGENQRAMYEALMGTENIRAYNADTGIRIELPEHYLVADSNNRLSDPGYIQLLKDYAKASHAYLKDRRESYWIDYFKAKIAYITYNETGMEITAVILCPVDYYEEIRDELALTDAELDTALQCLEGISNRYEKVKKAHDYVIDLITYNTENIEAAYGHTITGGLLDKYNHRAVCECYAKLFCLICTANDVPCILVTGGSSRNADGSINANHMWNYVQMEDGLWYLVDPTWDDSGTDSVKYLLAGSDTTGSNHMAVGVFGTVSTAQGTVGYDAFAVPVISERSYRKNVLKSISLEESKLTLEVESEGQIVVSEYLPEYADVSSGYLYTSSAPSVVSVDGRGVLTAKQAGTAVITVAGADCASVTTACTVTVRGHVFGELISEQKETCTENGMQTYQCSNEGCEKTQTRIVDALGHTYGEWVTMKEAACTEQSVQKKTCSRCGAEESRTVAARGHVPGEWKTVREATVLAEGLQEQRCTACNALLASRKISKAAASVTLNAASIPLQRRKSTAALTIVSCTPGDSVKSWTSSNTKIVTVNKNTGKITAKKVGSAKITVTMKSGAKASCLVKVQNSAVKTKKITVPKKTVKLAKGVSYTIKVTRSPITANDKLTFSSSNKKVAAVSSKGKITAKKKGTAKITVKSGSKKATIKVTVK